MENNKFNANGQVIYIEPRWVTGETCLFYITDRIMYRQAQTKLSKIRRDFILRLEDEGFIITYDRNEITEDVICLTMDELSIGDKDIKIADYKKEFDKLMFASGGEKLNYPYTLKVEEYFKNPFFPAVFKNELMNGGKDKFLIETEEQLEKIKKLYKDAASNKTISEAFNLSIFQQLIKTPTKYQTYIRVLISSSADVLGASLKYSKTEEKKREPQGIFEKIFWNENTEYYLDCKGMFNYYSEGGNISFYQPKYSTEKQEILKAHGINPDNPTIPEEVLEVSTSIAQKCNRQLGIICGIDFIYNEKDNKWYYLEIQSFPAIEEWAEKKGIRVNKIKNLDDSIKYCELDLEARHDALMMYMNKKQNEKGKQKILSL